MCLAIFGRCALKVENLIRCQSKYFLPYFLKDTHREIEPLNKTPAFTKSMNMDIWVVGTSNQLFIRGSYTETKFSKKSEHLLEKLRSLWQVHFALPMIFVLTLASESAFFYGNVAFSIFVLSTKKRYSSFLKKLFFLQKICFKVKVLKTSEISSNCNIKTCRSLKRRVIMKIPSNVF